MDAIFKTCQNCEKKESAWCNNCGIENLKANFCNWSSGTFKLDEFIRYTQLNAKHNTDYLEWINFNQFDLVKNINKRGAFSSIYSAIWTKGRIFDKKTEVCSTGPIEVILKRLDNSQIISEIYLRQVSINKFIILLPFFI